MMEDRIAELIGPFVSGAVALIVSLWLKESAGRIAKGLSFKFSRQFNEGDEVILEGDRALIVKIGFFHTVFGYYKTTKSSSRVNHYWRFVPNERIPYLKLEKIVSDTEDINNDKENE